MMPITGRLPSFAPSSGNGCSVLGEKLITSEGSKGIEEVPNKLCCWFEMVLAKVAEEDTGSEGLLDLC